MPEPHEPVNAASAFPSTQDTWIGCKLREGETGRGEILQHVIAVYSGPLAAYLVGSSFGHQGDPHDIVRGFLADRLARHGFLDQWVMSRRQLRHWLIVAFRHHLLEQARLQRRENKRQPRGTPAESLAMESVAVAPAAEEEFHRQAALAMVREALRMAEQSCRGSGKAEHWHVFIEHQHHGRSYDDVSRETNVSPQRLKVMARTAANHLRCAIRRLVAWEGADDAAIDDEIRSLMDAIQS
jgi:DNA-directed RNA polymerase specialized sigma24 family protein